MKRHINRVHVGKHSDKPKKPTMCICNFCNMSFLTQKEYANHCKLPHKCPICEQIFATRANLADHSNTVHKLKPKSYICSQCNKTFSRNCYLQLHIQNTHGEKNEFKCKLCNKVFIRKNSLKRHIRDMHENRRDNKCDICHESFHRPIQLTEHIQYIHDPKKNFSCKVCDKTFTQAYYLQVHIDSIHNDKKVQCNICLKFFSSIYYVRDHKKRTHDKETKPKCQFCEKYFSFNKTLRRHLKNFHNSAEMVEITTKNEVEKHCFASELDPIEKQLNKLSATSNEFIPEARNTVGVDPLKIELQDVKSEPLESDPLILENTSEHKLIKIETNP